MPTDSRSPAASVAFGPHGIDDVELLLAAHPGAPARPLQRGASGGELSRVMLAVEVVFAGADPVPTFVFDEVDAGVGGAAAVEVGRRLARLARSAQVIVVTHLPQVAAFADAHLVVSKSSDGHVTRSGVMRLDDDGRIGEIRACWLAWPTRCWPARMPTSSWPRPQRKRLRTRPPPLRDLDIDGPQACVVAVWRSSSGRMEEMRLPSCDATGNSPCRA